jgi:AraC-like DNA-binding protein
MHYRTYSPAPALRPYVKCYWILASEANPFQTAEPLIPDGCVELIINLGAPYRRHAVEGAGPDEFARGSHVVGERTHPFLIEQLGAIDHVAIRFRPGGLYAFARLAMNELTNRLVDAELLLGTDRPILEEQLSECRTDQSRVALLDGLLLRRLRAKDTRSELVQEAARIASFRGGLLSVRELCAFVDCDYKELERSFLTVVGVSPKFFCRLVRFLSVLESLNSGSRGSLAERAADFGYYDQAHFAKEFRSFTGVAPSQFVPRAASITHMLTSAPDSVREVSNSYKTA